MVDDPEDSRDLLLPLARAQDGLARLEATVAAASEPVREGLRARLAFREAAGWLAHQGHWIHPIDLALRDAGLTGSYAAARLGPISENGFPQVDVVTVNIPRTMINVNHPQEAAARQFLCLQMDSEPTFADAAINGEGSAVSDPINGHLTTAYPHRVGPSALALWQHRTSNRLEL